MSAPPLALPHTIQYNLCMFTIKAKAEKQWISDEVFTLLVTEDGSFAHQVFNLLLAAPHIEFHDVIIGYNLILTLENDKGSLVQELKKY